MSSIHSIFHPSSLVKPHHSTSALIYIWQTETLQWMQLSSTSPFPTRGWKRLHLRSRTVPSKKCMRTIISHTIYITLITVGQCIWIHSTLTIRQWKIVVIMLSVCHFILSSCMFLMQINKFMLSDHRPRIGYKKEEISHLQPPVIRVFDGMWTPYTYQHIEYLLLFRSPTFDICSSSHWQNTYTVLHGQCRAVFSQFGGHLLSSFLHHEFPLAFAILLKRRRRTPCNG